MGRPRKKNTGLPERVYQKHGAYYFVSAENKWVRLGKTKKEMFERLAEMEGVIHGVMNKMFDRYEKDVLPTLANSTQQSYSTYLIKLRSAFGRMKPCDVRPTHVAQYLDARTAKVAANREKAVLSSVFSHMMRWGVVDKNPCVGVSRNRETPRDRYVTDEEYAAVLELASLSMRHAMELARITGLRQGDILALTLSNIDKDGLHVTPSKTKVRTKKKVVFELTKGLRKIITSIKEQKLNQEVSSLHLVTKVDGAKYASSGFQQAWQVLIKKALSAGVISERFTYHDIRAKAGSDAPDIETAKKLLTHKSESQTEVYRRKTEVIKPGE